MSKKSADIRFMVLFSIVGLGGLIMSNLAHSNIPKSCESNFIRDGLTTVTIVSSVLLAIGVAFIICNFGLPFGSLGHVCYTSGKKSDLVKETYLTISIIISLSMSLILMIIGIQLSQGTCNGQTNEEKNMSKKLKFYIWSMFSLYVIVLGLSSFAMWYTIYRVPSWASTKETSTLVTKPKIPSRYDYSSLNFL